MEPNHPPKVHLVCRGGRAEAITSEFAELMQDHAVEMLPEGSSTHPSESVVIVVHSDCTDSDLQEMHSAALEATRHGQQTIAVMYGRDVATEESTGSTISEGSPDDLEALQTEAIFDSLVEWNAEAVAVALSGKSVWPDDEALRPLRHTIIRLKRACS